MGAMGKDVEGVVRGIVGDGAFFAPVAGEEGGKEGEGPIVGG